MEDEKEKFSWSGLFIITACCSFLFNIAIKLLDGSFSDMLFIIGGIAAFLGVVNWLIITVTAYRQATKRKRRKNNFAS